MSYFNVHAGSFVLIIIRILLLIFGIVTENSMIPCVLRDMRAKTVLFLVLFGRVTGPIHI